MGLSIEVFQPGNNSIKSLIECYWHVTSIDFVGPLINIPDGRQEIVIDLLNKTLATDFGRLYPVFKQADRNVDLLIVRFHAYGLTCLTKQFLKQRSYKKTGQLAIRPEQLYLSVLSDFFANKSVARKIESFEGMIKKTMTGATSIEPIVLDLIAKIHSTRGCQKINTLYYNYALSGRQLQIHFKNYTGMTPKNFSKIVRLSGVRRVKSLHDKVSLTALSYEYGYSDQSHLIKDFKQISGLSPLKYLKRKSAVQFIVHS